MLYDTISICSPVIPALDYQMIKESAKRVEAVDLCTGEVLWQVTTSEIMGSYDSRLHIKFNDDYKMTITGSVHKFILGHNVLGGPVDIKDCCRYLVALAYKRLGVDLPLWDSWELVRCDVAYIFALSSKEEVQEFFKMMRGCVYPRRQAQNFGLNSVYFPGASTTIKAYNKGPEFRFHDRARLLKLKDLYSKDQVDLLEKVGDRIVRFEVEVRRRKLKYDKVDTRCGSLKDDYFTKLYVSEVCKILKEGDSEMEIVRSIDDVKSRLQQIYSARKANNLFGVWSRIQLEGENTVKNSVSRATWWRYCNELCSAGISLKGSVRVLPGLDIAHGSNLRDFVPLPGNKFEVDGIFLDVKEALSQLELTA